MIKAISIIGLFGYKEINIIFNHDITILTGLNGSGKTTVLNIINDISTGNYYNLYNYKFSSINVKFADKSEIIAKYNIETNKDKPTISMFLKKGRKQVPIIIENFDEIAEKIPSDIWSEIDEDIEELVQINPRAWKDIYTGERYTRSEILQKFAYRDSLLKKYIITNNLLQGLMPDVCKYIGTNRLIRFENIKTRYRELERKMVSSIDLIAKNIKEEIVNESSKYISYSQNIDSTYPFRLIEKSKKTSDLSKINNTINDLDLLIERLFDVGLIENKSKKTFKVKNTISDFELRALNLYYNDQLEKFNYLLPLEKKLKIFKDKITAKLQNSKSIEFSKDFGFKIYSLVPTSVEIPVNTLSSGEQHEIIMLYDLLFSKENVKLFLIDEPEISLHLDWQREYIADLMEILGSNSNMQIVIATHAPAIIGNYLNKCVEI